MVIVVDHSSVLGLPSGEEGAKFTEKEISKAYKQKALELHPDKRPGDPNAHANFQRLISSYEILKDEKARKLFDDLLRVRSRASKKYSKRQKRNAFPEARQEEEDRIARKVRTGFKAYEEYVLEKLQKAAAAQNKG